MHTKIEITHALRGALMQPKPVPSPENAEGSFLNQPQCGAKTKKMFIEACDVLKLKEIIASEKTTRVCISGVPRGANYRNYPSAIWWKGVKWSLVYHEGGNFLSPRWGYKSEQTPVGLESDEDGFVKIKEQA